MNIPKGRYNDLIFILAIAAFGLTAGTVLSLLHSVCTRSFDHFITRPLIGLVCGAVAALVHTLLRKLINRLSKGRFQISPFLFGIQFTIIAYLLFLAIEITVFRSRMNEPSHKYWIIACSFFAFVTSSLIFSYHRLTDMIHGGLGTLEKLHMGLTKSLVTMLDIQDPLSAGHSIRVAEGCDMVARRLGLSGAVREKLRRAAFIHDIGKIGIDDTLQAGGEKDFLEHIGVRNPLIAEKILTPLQSLTWETHIIKTAHFFTSLTSIEESEKLKNDTLTPSIRSLVAHSLPGESLEDLPVEAKILSAVDFFDTIIHSGAKVQALPEGEALRELRAGAGRRFDSHVVEIISSIVEKGQWPSSDRDEAVWSEFFPQEDDIQKEIRKTARGLSLMNRFYEYMGIGQRLGTRAFLLAFFSGLFTGVFLGLVLYATTSNPVWIHLFIFTGLLGGLIAWTVGYPMEWYFSKKYPHTSLNGPAGGFISFLAGGIPAALISYYAFIYPETNNSGTFDIFAFVYTATITLISAALGTCIRYFQNYSFRLLKSQRKLQKTYLNLVYALSYLLEQRDPYTRGHSEKVSTHALAMGKVLGLGQEDLEELEKAALFHDIGKLVISQKIIKKTSKLSDEEYAIIKTHPAFGAEILEPVKYYKDLSPFVLAHHESFDGRGYPEKKKKEEIPLFARIIAIADSYDAMVSDRAYRKGLPRETAIAELKKNAGTQFDPRLVELFIKTLD